jgi:hypothetical protein
MTPAKTAMVKRFWMFSLSMAGASFEISGRIPSAPHFGERVEIAG